MHALFSLVALLHIRDLIIGDRLKHKSSVFERELDHLLGLQMRQSRLWHLEAHIMITVIVLPVATTIVESRDVKALAIL